MNNELAIIFDDHQLFSISFSSLVQRHGLFKHVHSFHKIEPMLEFISKFGNREICIFLDYYLSNAQNGLTVQTEIKRLNKKVKVIFITSSTSPAILNHIYITKPHAILSKNCEMRELISCLTHDSVVGTYLDPDIQKFLNNFKTTAVLFSNREIELLHFFEAGCSIKATAGLTFLSPHTIIAHRRNMMARAGVTSIGQLLKYAKDNELI